VEKRCPSALQNSNAFRTRFCYLEATSVVIEQNLASLKTLYESYAEVSRGAADHLVRLALPLLPLSEGP